MKLFIDTNVFLRTIVNDNLKMQNESKAFFGRVAYSPRYDLYTSTLVITEILWTLQKGYSLNKGECIQVIESIRGIGNLDIVDRFALGGALDIYGMKKIKFIDSLLATIPEVNIGDWVVVSYDKDFDKIGIKRLEPREIG